MGNSFSVPRSEGFGAVLLKICEVLKGDRRVVAFLVLENEWFRESIVNQKAIDQVIAWVNSEIDSLGTLNLSLREKLCLININYMSSLNQYEFSKIGIQEMASLH